MHFFCFNLLQEKWRQSGATKLPRFLWGLGQPVTSCKRNRPENKTKTLIGWRKMQLLQHVLLYKHDSDIHKIEISPPTINLLNWSIYSFWNMQVSYPLLIFFCGMFITVDGFNQTGLPSALWNFMEPYARINHVSGVVVLSLVILLLSNFASNVPTGN